MPALSFVTLMSSFTILSAYVVGSFITNSFVMSPFSATTSVSFIGSFVFGSVYSFTVCIPFSVVVGVLATSVVFTISPVSLSVTSLIVSILPSSSVFVISFVTSPDMDVFSVIALVCYPAASVSTIFYSNSPDLASLVRVVEIILSTT